MLVPGPAGVLAEAVGGLVDAVHGGVHRGGEVLVEPHLAGQPLAVDADAEGQQVPVAPAGEGRVLDQRLRVLRLGATVVGAVVLAVRHHPEDDLEAGLFGRRELGPGVADGFDQPLGGAPEHGRGAVRAVAGVARHLADHRERDLDPGVLAEGHQAGGVCHTQVAAQVVEVPVDGHLGRVAVLGHRGAGVQHQEVQRGRTDGEGTQIELEAGHRFSSSAK